MNSLKEQILSQASIIVGNGNFSPGANERIERTRNVADTFIDSVMEDMFLAVGWGFAIRCFSNPDNIRNQGEFTTTSIKDCLKVVSIVPGICQWYILNEELFFKGADLERAFYFSGERIRSLITKTSTEHTFKIPFSYISLCGLALASEITHSIHSESVFTDGLKAQYLRKLKETREIHQFDYNIENAATF
ncbi:MAG: hypothetical protein GY858_09845 [Candidatus Omnitrophica bacterium]|nr:hypothetical protein [Candidatus Omnitrophota bacterium]